jgi:uncharacterized protein (TIGR01777 family)
MRILLTGGTGFLGHAIASELLVRGHELVVVSRNADRARAHFPYPARFESWDPEHSVLPAAHLEGVDAVVHLAGEPVAAKRWSPEQKRRIRESRVLGTRHFWQGLAQARSQGKAGRLKAFVAGSAIGFYGHRGHKALLETTAAGQGFLAEVCQQWENEIFRPGFDEIRTVAVRTGVVLGREGGALAKLLPVFRLGAGGPVGSGDQWMSWIHLQDIARIFAEAVENPGYRGVINGVAPKPVTNADFARALGRVLKKPALLPAPALALKLALGEMAGMVLDSQRVKPESLMREGFQFLYPELEGALQDLCAPEGEPADDQFVAEQWVPRPVDQVFPFFSEAKNLEDLTPPWLSFAIEKVSHPKIRQGTLIDYKLRLHGLSLKWRTRIEKWEPNRSFVDNQLRGPYAKWHHTHTFTPAGNGTLMRDRVVYRLPLGLLGKRVAHWKVRRQIAEIFAYRRKRVGEIFSAPSPHQET